MGASGTRKSGSKLQLSPPIMRAYIREITAPSKYNRFSGTYSGASWGKEYVNMRWVPVTLEWSACGELSTAQIRYMLGGDSAIDQIAPEDLLTAPGTKVRIVDDETGYEWFAGYVGQEEMLIQAQPQQESYSLTIYGPEHRLEEMTVYGRHYAAADIDDKVIEGTDIFTDRRPGRLLYTDEPCIFNEDGKPNCSTQKWRLCNYGSSNHGYVFEGAERSAKAAVAIAWTAYAALRTMVELWDADTIISMEHTDWGAIKKLLDGITLPEVDVDGKTLLDAIKAVLLPVGFGFYLEPWSAGSDGSYKHRFVVYSLKDSKNVRNPRMAIAGRSISSETNSEVQRLHMVWDDRNVQNDVRILGSPKRIQVCLKYDGDNGLLKPVWAIEGTHTDLSDYANDEDDIDIVAASTAGKYYMARFHTEGAEHFKYKHAWRSFALNEDGSFADIIEDIPDLYDKFKIGDPSVRCAARRPRPVLGTLMRENDFTLKTLPPKVYLKANGVFVDITSACEVWKDRAGFTITKELIEVDQKFLWKYWRPFGKSLEKDCTAAMRQLTYLQMLHNTIRDSETGFELWLVGTLEDDSYLTGHSAKSNDTSWPIERTAIVRAPKFQKQTASAGFFEIAATDGYSSIDSPAQYKTDDSTIIRTYAKKLRNSRDDQMGHGSVTLFTISDAYPPGTMIKKMKGRDIRLDVDGGNKSHFPIVRRVSFVFEQTNTTELMLDSPMLGLGV